MRRLTDLLIRYRILLLVYGFGLIVALWERNHAPPPAETDDVAVLPPHADALVKIWPEHADACYVRSIRARYLRFDLEEALAELQTGLERAPKSTERIVYAYAYVLTLMEGSKDLADAAVRRWQREFPYSDFQDPRALDEGPFPALQIAASHWLSALSPEGRTLARIPQEGTVELWNVHSGEVDRYAPADTRHAAHVLCFSTDGRRLLVHHSGHQVSLMNTETKAVETVFSGHAHDVYSAAVSPDGSQCATGDANNDIRLWDAQSGHELRVITEHTRPVSALAWSSDGTMLASGDWNGTIQLTDQKSGDSKELKHHIGAIASLVFAPDDGLLAAAGRDAKVTVWDTQTGKIRHTLKEHDGPISRVVFDHTGEFLASGGSDGRVVICRARSGKRMQSVRLPSTIIGIQFATNAPVFSVAAVNGSVQQFPLRIR